MQEQWNHKIFNVDKSGFDNLALEIFNYQYLNNPVYKSYVDAIGVVPAGIKKIEQIPFLPIGFFKTHAVKTGSFKPAVIFESSGTTGSINSRHLVKDLSLYEESFLKGFVSFYGTVKDYCIIGLLPSYLERNNSSLVYMVNELVTKSDHPRSGFYLNEYDRLLGVLNELENSRQKTILIGVTFALLDLAEKHTLPLQHTIIIETGGMKGRRKEMIRQEVHAIIKNAFAVPFIHSEYGMTELLSQAYSKGDGIFQCPPWMKVVLRDDEDPLSVNIPDFQNRAYSQGAINIIDLANIHSCSFIATDDAGRLYPDDSFEVLGRMDHSDLRGCSLMVL